MKPQVTVMARKRKRHNPEKRSFQGKSYKKGGERVRELRDKDQRSHDAEVVVSKTTMAKEQATALLRKLRCIGCKRAPTEIEVEEMFVVFGAKLEVDARPEKLAWVCLACGRKHS